MSLIQWSVVAAAIVFVAATIGGLAFSAWRAGKHPSAYAPNPAQDNSNISRLDRLDGIGHE